MFEEYPKIRPEISPQLQEIYAVHYKENRQGKSAAASLAQKMESWMHKQVARDTVNQSRIKFRTLEIGAGTLNQLPYELNHVGQYDIVEPFHDLYVDSPYITKVVNCYDDIAEIPVGEKYNRITSVACFEHILNLPEVVARVGLLLANDGELRVAIPSEGTLLWGLGWRLTTGLEFKIKHKLDYGELMRYEHVNTAIEIENILKYFFDDVVIRVFGICKSLSLYQFLICRKPNVERCEDYLQKLS